MTGGRTFWGFEGPPPQCDDDPPPRGRLAQDRLGAHDGSASEDEDARRENWKKSWRQLVGGEAAGQVRHLLHAFEAVRGQEEVVLQQTTDSARRAATSIRRNAAPPAEPLHYYSDFPVMRACDEDRAIESSDAGSPSSPLLPRPTTSRPTRAPIPSLTRGTISAPPPPYTIQGDRIRRYTCVDEGDVSDLERDTVRPVRAGDGRATSRALGRMFDLDDVVPSKPSPHRWAAVGRSTALRPGVEGGPVGTMGALHPREHNLDAAGTVRPGKARLFVPIPCECFMPLPKGMYLSRLTILLTFRMHA